MKTRRWQKLKREGSVSYLVMVLLPLWIGLGAVASAAWLNTQDRQRRMWILGWTIFSFFLVPVVGGLIYGGTLGYAITHGTACALSSEFVVGCSVAALVVGRLGYALAILGLLPGTQFPTEPLKE